MRNQRSQRSYMYDPWTWTNVGECWWKGIKERKKWDNYNSTINKIYFKKEGSDYNELLSWIPMYPLLSFNNTNSQSILIYLSLYSHPLSLLTGLFLSKPKNSHEFLSEKEFKCQIYETFRSPWCQLWELWNVSHDSVSPMNCQNISLSKRKGKKSM